MTMLIGKFHRMIQSRLLWGTFLVIIVMTFVVWGTRFPGQSNKAKEANAAGKLFGKHISQEEFREAYYSTYMSAVLAVGHSFDITARLDKELRKAAWRRLASLLRAKELGFTSSDEEVMATIQSHPGFSVDGRFSPAYYNAFVQNVLGRMGFNELQFEEHVREEITLQKLQQMVQQGVLVSPYEITRTFRSLTDAFDVQYVKLTRQDVEKGVKVTREDAQAFFMADPAAFTIPEKARVAYISVPASNYMADVTVTEDDQLEYYDQHIDEFTVTNTVPVLPGDTSDTNVPAVAQMTNKVETLGFDLVKTNILERLTYDRALNSAAEKATDFVVSLAPDREGNAPTFDEAAAAAKLEVYKPEPFAVNDEVPGVDAGYAFNKAVFALNKTPDEYFTDAIAGSNAVYVAGLIEKISERVPEFDEVADQVMEAAREHALNEALSKKAQEVREAAMKAVDAGKSFADGVKPFSLKVVDTGSFTASSALGTNEYAEILLRGVLARNQGEVSDLLPTDDDSVLLAYVAERKAGDPASLESLRPQIRDSVKRQRTRLLFEDWQTALLREAQFEDRVAAAQEQAASDEGMTDESMPADEGTATNAEGEPEP